MIIAMTGGTTSTAVKMPANPQTKLAIAMPEKRACTGCMCGGYPYAPGGGGGYGWQGEPLGWWPCGRAGSSGKKGKAILQAFGCTKMRHNDILE
ncbi:hypothetical protein GCM10023194_15480 [Planotetraspora phitsanulokensis]|uniref:Uncharacterized protein n=1 Tax=Planotetraspora phitsanulokensis TaxID=575192 RepID=A0A8J3XF77_9ACTN|nr:hypothetical protein Pph01_38430 [Planotetraspora phitsanulokensis]